MYDLLYPKNFESFRRNTHITIWEKSIFLGLLILLRLVYFLNFLEDCVKSKLAFEDCVSQWKDLYFSNLISSGDPWNSVIASCIVLVASWFRLQSRNASASSKYNESWKHKKAFCFCKFFLHVIVKDVR